MYELIREIKSDDKDVELSIVRNHYNTYRYSDDKYSFNDVKVFPLG